MKAAAVSVPPEEEEIMWASSGEWRSAALRSFLRSWSLFSLEKERLLRVRSKNERLGDVVAALVLQ